MAENDARRSSQSARVKRFQIILQAARGSASGMPQVRSYTSGRSLAGHGFNVSGAVQLRSR